MVVIVNLLKRIRIMLQRSALPCVVVALVLGVLGAANAQTSPAKNDSDKNILADSEAVFPMDDNLVLRGYSNRHRIAYPVTVTHAVVMIHGVLRNPDNYYLPAQRVLERKLLFTKVALIFVGFDDHDSAPRKVQRLALFGSRWKHGDFGGLNPDDPNNKLSSFGAMDRILLDLTETYPRLKRITLIGHSAGAQFVDRYSVLSSIAAKVPGVRFRFVALAPSSVLYPSELRPEVGKEGRLSFSIPSGAHGYNEYPYGLSPTPLLERMVGHPVADHTQMVNKFLDRNIVFAVGTLDTTSDYLDQGRSANTQGPNRYTRLKYFVEFLKTKYHSSNTRLLPIAGVGHSSQRLIRSREMSEFFSDH